MHTPSLATGRAALAAALLLSLVRFAPDVEARPLAPTAAADAVVERALSYVSGASLGGSVTCVAAGPAGMTYVAGTTSAEDIPTTPGAFQATKPSASDSNDGFVMAIDGAGRVVYTTYLGGDGDDAPWKLAVDGSGNAYVVGRTTSTNFPADPRGAYGDAPRGDGFLAKLDPTGSHLLYGTFLGGDGDLEWALGVVATDDGIAYVVGDTNSHDFPTTSDAFQRQISGTDAAFIVKVDTRLSGAASIPYATLFGGDGATVARDVVLGPDGAVYVTGGTDATTLPVSPTAYRSALTGGFDAFALVLDPSRPGADGLLYSTYFGGDSEDQAVGIGVHDGKIEIAGQTSSAALPTTAGAIRSAQLPGAGGLSANDGFVAVIDPSKGASAGLVYATYFGGSGEDDPQSATVDAAGNVWVVGQTYSSDLPVTSDAAGRNAPDVDGFVAEIAPEPVGAAGLVYASYLGGQSTEICYSVDVDADGRAVVGGYTTSNDLPRPRGSVEEPPSVVGVGFVATFEAPVTDLRLAASPFDPDPAPRGDLAAVTLTATNAGPASARFAELVFDVPDGTTFDSATDADGVPLSIAAGSPSPIRVALGTLEPDASTSATIRVRLTPQPDGTIDLSARVTCSTIDSSPANDSVAATVRAINYPKLASVSAQQEPAFRVVIRGADFQPGVAVYIGDDATRWPTIKLKGTTKITLKGRGLKDRFPKNVLVPIRVVNANGGSVTGSFTR